MELERFSVPLGEDKVKYVYTIQAYEYVSVSCMSMPCVSVCVRTRVDTLLYIYHIIYIRKNNFPLLHFIGILVGPMMEMILVQNLV